jgi:hypothetical protein
MIALGCVVVMGCGNREQPDDCVPHASGGECNVLIQCGCPDGAYCELVVDCLAWRVTEECKFRTPGTLDVEEVCSGTDEFCRPGTKCRSTGTDPDPFISLPWACSEYCLTDEDCSIPGRTCDVPHNYECGWGTSIPLPYGECSQDWPWTP